MQPDSHGDGDGWYRITSLYYDSPDRACYRAKIEGIKYRRKVRIRTYGRHVDDPSQVVLLEIKQRINRTVQKRRIAVPWHAAVALVEDGKTPEGLSPEDLAVAAEIDFLGRTLQLEPACVISYRRQAWVGSRFERGLRITFDEDMTCRGPERGLATGIPDHAFMAPDAVIMEVKVDETVPLWVTRMLARHGCPLRRISKYCKGIEQLAVTDRTLERSQGESWTNC